MRRTAHQEFKTGLAYGNGIASFILFLIVLGIVLCETKGVRNLIYCFLLLATC